MTREERRYWRIQRIKATAIMVAVFILAVVLPAVVE